MLQGEWSWSELSSAHILCVCVNSEKVKTLSSEPSFVSSFAKANASSVAIAYVTSVAIANFCLFDLILYVPSTIFRLNRDMSSCVEPVLS